jgi:hypothetical protein
VDVDAADYSVGLGLDEGQIRLSVAEIVSRLVSKLWVEGPERCSSRRGSLHPIPQPSLQRPLRFHLPVM